MVFLCLKLKAVAAYLHVEKIKQMEGRQAQYTGSLTLLHLTGFGKNATIPACELCSLITRKLYGYVNSNPYIF